MLNLTRRSDWRVRLNEAIRLLRRQPLVWGENDCGIGLAAKAIEAMTGIDPAAEFRGKYSTAAGALKLIKQAGFDDLESYARSLLPEVHPSTAKAGDIAFLAGDELGAFGVFNGDGHILVQRPEGIGVVSLLDAKTAFQV